MSEENWELVAKQKRHSVRAEIPSKWILDSIPSADEEPNTLEYLDKIVTKKTLSITSKTMRELIKQISSGELTSLEVTEAFCERAAYAHQILSCCSEIFFDRALETAKKLDAYYKETGKVVGPLHGIPVSLKDQVNLEGIETSIGYVSHLGKPATKDDESVIAHLLRDAGAVFYVKTTVPMAMMAGDTHSNIWGYTYNSINRHLSAGGSSGGEGALIGSHGSLIGLGTDIGGSIRIPAAFNHLFGLRPSHGRIPYLNVTNSYSGQSVIPSVIGPLAKDLDDLEVFTKIIVDAESWNQDPKVVPIPWRHVSLENKLSFGVMRWDGVIHPNPPVNRAIEMTITALIKAGHEVIDWEPQGHAEILQVTGNIYNADGYKEILDTCEISGEPSLVQKEGLVARTLNEHWSDADDKYRIQKRYMDYWNETSKRTFNGKPVSAWILPAWESASFKPYTPDALSTYMATINLLDYSAVTVPVTYVDKNVDTPYPDFVPANKIDKDVHEWYDPVSFDGAPVGVQVVTRRLEEEKAIAIARVLRDCLA
ncbi:Amd2p [Sugiyamaella lignohabitans]|uniref:amidase n=1 Tax=Sugiyamaella lignohabitans TaxID=796027 RepID=A0A161HJD1_9ASCO|nr:Amd2p [Sugiyamaella lignohabitans]ANB11508.1 Amd2p [Sugiyamaella lignohabitans]